LDHFAKETEAQDHAANAPGVQHFQLVRQKRTARDGHEGFRNFFRDRMQSCGQAARQDGNGYFIDGQTHEMTSLVPSKSNRKRTSFKPLWRMA